MTKQRNETKQPAAPEQIVRPEINLEKAQLWTPTNSNAAPVPRTVRRKAELPADWEVKGVKVGELAVQYKVTVGCCTELGPLTTDDQRVYYALVRLREEQGAPAACAFSRRRIARILGRDGCQRSLDLIADSLKRLRHTPFYVQYHYLDPETKAERFVEDSFTILEDLKLAYSKQDGHITTEGSVFRFSELIEANLRAGKTKPVLLDQVCSFKSDIAQLLYLQLDLILHNKNQYERRSIELFTDLGLTGTTYKHAAARKRVLERVCKELKGKRLTTGVITSAVIQPTKDTKDIKIVVTKGRAVKQLPAAPALTPPAETAAPQTGQAAQLVAHFYFVFFGQRAPGAPQKRELGQAQTLLEQYGFEQTKFIIEFARREAQATQFAIQTFGGVMQYASRACDAGAQQREHAAQASRVTEEAAQLAQYEALYHETYLWPKVEQVLASGTAEAHALQQQLDSWNILDQHPDLQNIKLSSAAGFFREHPALGVLSFLDWDKQHNPQPFRTPHRAALAQHA